MSTSLQLAAIKWARAVRDRQSATAAKRRVKLQCTGVLRLAREVDASDAVTAARKRELREQKALLKVVEKSITPDDGVIDVQARTRISAAAPDLRR